MSTPFGKFMRSKRVAAGLSLRALADEMEVSHTYLGEVERGVRGPLARDRWDDLVKAIDGITVRDLEKHAETSRPIQLELADAPPRYQDLGLALARRIEEQSLADKDVDALLRILSGKRKKKKRGPKG